MRRQIVAAALCTSLAATALAATGTSARAALTPAPAPTEAPETAPVEPTPRQALATAVDVLSGQVPTDLRSGTTPDAAAADATLALRDLRVALPRLTGSDRERAEALLARPTDGRNDPYGDGYRARSKRDCTTTFCLHWVTRTEDAPPSRRWVARNRKVLTAVWRTEVGQLGYRAPRPDGRRGGSRKLDVYLKELGGQGLYGYCAPETRGGGRQAAGYCVLDDDFARSQFKAPPADSLRVTAAHEFLHAVQFGYDYLEDRWLLEATATWMEERFADGVNDNRRYLRSGQFGVPGRPLDSTVGLSAYGNWVFFEYLSERFGRAVVRRIWEQAGEAPSDGGTYSLDAVSRALPESVALDAVFADYAMALTTPAAGFPEGRAWGPASFASTATLGRDATRDATMTIKHLASRSYQWLPGGDLDSTTWQLRVSVDGPEATRSPTAGVVQVGSDGTTSRTRIDLDAEGIGSVTVPFNAVDTEAVHVVLGNASTRLRPDDDQRVQLSVDVVGPIG